jgi:hypothetical protein
LIKEETRGYVFLAHNLLSHFVYNCHITPYGVVVKPGKKDRPISDASFHPEIDSTGINDWTSKDDELPVIFQESERAYYREMYNLRITCPTSEIVQGNDDVQGAFKHLRANLNLVGMHAFLFESFIGFCTSQIFGGTTCPPNWEIIARPLAPKTGTISFHYPRSPFLPLIELLAPPPLLDEILQFATATRDSKNPGIALDASGNVPSPGFFHHVDDNMCATLGDFDCSGPSASVAHFTV